MPIGDSDGRTDDRKKTVKLLGIRFRGRAGKPKRAGKARTKTINRR